MRIGHQGCLARALKTQANGVCCIQETSYAIRLASPPSHPVKFHLRISGDPETAASDVAGVGLALSERAEATLLDWTPVDSRL